LNNALKILLVAAMLAYFAQGAPAADPEESTVMGVRLDLTASVDFPEPIMDGLHSVIFATLDDVLLKRQTHSINSLNKHASEVSDAIREGLNVVLEPKGFTVSEVALEAGVETTVKIEIMPAGGVSGEPGPVCTGVEIELLRGHASDFWDPILSRALESVRDKAEAYYARYLVNIPLVVTDESFILNAIAPYTGDTTIIGAAFPDYTPVIDVEPGAISKVNVALDAPSNPVQRLRVRMSGDTIPNVVLDELRDAITSRSETVVGMPKSLVMASVDDIGAHFANLVETDPDARFFDAKAKVRFDFDDEDNSLIAMCEVRSRIYDVNLRGYIDFGLEDADSSEVEGRVGYFFAPEIEIMVVLNLYTNDMTLEPDALLGWRPREGSFFAGGYDIEAKGSKFFISQELGENIFAEAEIFAENDRSQYGLLYRFHQYF
jgi:hypothetical protein